MPRRSSSLGEGAEKQRTAVEPARVCGRFVVEQRDARQLHYDFRLELDGVLKSWAVTRGPSLDPADKRLAVRTTDHPLAGDDHDGSAAAAEAAAAGGQLWDRGQWRPRGDPREDLDRGLLKFELEGGRLRGGFALVRLGRKARETRENWLLIKERDAYARQDGHATDRWLSSVVAGRAVDVIAQNGADAARPAGARRGRRPTPRERPGFLAATDDSETGSDRGQPRDGKGDRPS